jgi:uncharacterized protein YdeI (YjbR/CyaY-like superfamily)
MPSSKPMLDVRTRQEWRTWLDKHHATSPEVWLVFHKRHTGVDCLTYDDAVEEALCYGWVDSTIKRIDDRRYVRKFTPRRADSKWSSANRRRHERLAEQGLLAAAGRRRRPTARDGDARRPSVTRLPAYLEDGLRQDKRAWEFFWQLAPSYRRAYIGWITSAKRPETRQRRIREAVRLLAAGEKLGLK